MPQLSIFDLERAERLFPQYRRYMESALRKLYTGDYNLTPEEKKALALVYATRSIYGYRIDVAKKAHIGNPFREKTADVPGVDTPDALPLYRWAAAMVKGAVHRPAPLPGQPRLEHYFAKQRKRELEAAGGTGEASTAVRVEAGGRRRRGWSSEEQSLAQYLWDSMPPYARKKWSYIQVLHLARRILEWSRKAGIDPRSIDWAHEIDWGMGYRAALERARSLLMQGRGAPGESEVEEYLRYLEASTAVPQPPQVAEEQPQPWELRAWEEARIPT